MARNFELGSHLAFDLTGKVVIRSIIEVTQGQNVELGQISSHFYTCIMEKTSFKYLYSNYIVAGFSFLPNQIKCALYVLFLWTTIYLKIFAVDVSKWQETFIIDNFNLERRNQNFKINKKGNLSSPPLISRWKTLSVHIGEIKQLVTKR